jgi:PAS domain S-box-containing protein
MHRIRPRILIVEDDSIIAMELQERLRDLEYEVCGKTGTAENAVILAEGLRPDLVLMDIRLKAAMDGVEAAGRIQSQFDIPVVYLTAHADDDTLARAKATEPYGYIIKPFEERELTTAIEMALYKHNIEKKLRQSEQWLAATLRSIGDAVIATDEKAQIVFINHMAGLLLGLSPQQAVDRDVNQVMRLIDSETRLPPADTVADVVRDGRSLELDGKLLLIGDSHSLPIDGQATPIRDEQDQVKGAVVAFRDVSARQKEQKEREQLQDRLYRAQQKETVAAVAGNLIHEFNNLVTAVLGSATLLEAHLSEEQGPLHRAVMRIQEAGQQATALMDQILPGSQPRPFRPQLLDLDKVVKHKLEELAPLFGEQIEVDVISGLEPDQWYLRIDPAQLEELVTSLITNAQEAMPGGGKLTIRTDVITIEKEEIGENGWIQPGPFLRLSVIDNGMGMDDETQTRAFEPFFTTKPKSLGLGLAVARGIVNSFRGWIEVSSTYGQGSTFQVHLPAVAARAQEDTSLDQPAKKIHDLQGQGEKILVVEDDKGVRSAIIEMLHDGGYVVTAVGSAKEARALGEKDLHDFALLFCDVVLPDGDGLALADSFREARPKTAVVMTSGYTDQRARWMTIQDRGYHYLQKPFGLRDLLETVQKALLAERN